MAPVTVSASRLEGGEVELMKCPACGGPLLPEPTTVVPNGMWQCTACFEMVDTRLGQQRKARKGAPEFQAGEVWLDSRGRRHRVEASKVRGLVVLVAIDDRLAPDCRRPADTQGWRKAPNELLALASATV